MQGVTLAWIPFILFTVPIFISVFRSVSRQKATGLGAVAGGFTEAFTTLGLLAFLVSQIGAIWLLTRTFEKGHALRGLVSIVSIACSLALLFMMASAMWLLVRFPH